MNTCTLRCIRRCLDFDTADGHVPVSPGISCGEPIFKVFQLLVCELEGLESMRLGFTLQRKGNNTVERKQPAIKWLWRLPELAAKTNHTENDQNASWGEKRFNKEIERKEFTASGCEKMTLCRWPEGRKIRWELRVAVGLKATLSGLHRVWYHKSSFLIHVFKVDFKHSVLNEKSASVFENVRYLKSFRLDATLDILKRGRVVKIELLPSIITPLISWNAL